MKTIHFRRKREGKTDYRKRLKMLSSRERRLVARFTRKSVVVQLVEFGEKGDRVVASATAKDLKSLGWKYSLKNTPAAYLMGYILGVKAKKAKIESAIFDIGLKDSIPKSKVFAILKGAVDAGLNVPHSSEAFPDDNRISGKHIESYSENSSESQFSGYLKQKSDPKNISKSFEEIKAKIK